MIKKRTLWIPAGIVLLALAITQTHLPLSAEGPASRADNTAKPKMKMQCPMMSSMKGMKVFSDGPAVLLSRAEELGLTAKQKKRLEKIQQKARRKAHGVLTAEQREKLKDSPKGRLSMMEIAMRRMKKMKGQKEQHGMMCPMCMKMMRKKMSSQKDENQ